MTQVMAHTVDDLLDILRAQEPQQIMIADEPKRLRLGWCLSYSDLLITTSLIEAKARWPKSIFELIMAEQGREAFRDLLYERAWGV